MSILKKLAFLFVLIIAIHPVLASHSDWERYEGKNYNDYKKYSDEKNVKYDSKYKRWYRENWYKHTDYQDPDEKALQKYYKYKKPNRHYEDFDNKDDMKHYVYDNGKYYKFDKKLGRYKQMH